MSNFLFTLATFMLVLGVLVFVHELGHYWAAKAFGIWVHRFAVGIGSPIPGMSFKRGETEWAFAWLPIGGYVKMASREEDPASSVLEGGSAVEVPPDRVFEAKPVWQRMIVILAGVTLNTIFAFLIFTGLAFKNGHQYDPTLTIGLIDRAALPEAAVAPLAAVQPGDVIAAVNGAPATRWADVIDGIATGSADPIVLALADGRSISIPLHRDALVERAHLAQALSPMPRPVIGRLLRGGGADVGGLMPGDSIVAINAVPVRFWTDMVDTVQAAAGQTLLVSVSRDGTPMDMAVTVTGEPRSATDSTLVGRIGVYGATAVQYESLSLGGAVSEGARLTAVAATSIGRMLRGLVNGRVSHREVGGPILIGQMAADAARAGLDPLLALMALISINLAVMNLLPIPVLDGGAFLLLVYEGITGRPLPERLRVVVTMIGLAMVVLLMVLATSNDLIRFFRSLGF